MSEAVITEQQRVEEATAKLNTARAEYDKLNKQLLADMPNISAEAAKSGDTATMLARMGEVGTAKTRVEQAEKALEVLTAQSRWENLAPARKPVEDALRTLIIDAGLTVPVVAVKGVARIEDGKMSVSLKPELDKVDMTALEAEIAKAFDTDAFAATKVTSVEINVLGIGNANASVNLQPTDKISPRFRNPSSDGTATRAGGLEYEYNGSWLGTRQLLEAVEASGHEVVTRYKGRFDRFHVDGNGMSNLGKDVAKVLGLPSRDKAPAA